jgi:hypothetical protein
MPNFVHILLRILAGIAGALLLYVAFFLYEDEEARLQNRLEEIWHKIDALQSQAMSKEVAFFQGVTRTASSILDDLFGRKLVSSQSICVSFIFSMASLALWLIFIDFGWAIRNVGTVVLFVSIAASLVVFGFLSEPTGILLTYRWNIALSLSLFLLISLLLSAIALVRSEPTVPIDIVGRHLETVAYSHMSAIAKVSIGLVLAAGISIDIVFIVFFRWILREITKYSTLWAILLSFISTAMLVLLLTGPAVIITSPSLQSRFLSHVGKATHTPLTFIGFICMTNLVDALCLLLLLAIMGVLLAHRVLWPLVKRPIYAANRKQLIKNSKLLGALGTMLLMYAFPHNRFVEWITQHLPILKGG